METESLGPEGASVELLVLLFFVVCDEDEAEKAPVVEGLPNINGQE